MNEHAGHGAAHTPGEAELREIEQLIANVPIFSGLGDADIARLATHVRPRHYSPNTQLYGAGDTNPNLLVIHTGRVKIYRLSESGHEQVIRILGPGDFLGESSFLTSEPTDHFAVTVEAGEICSLNARDLREYLMNSPSVAVTMLATLSSRLGTTEELVSSLTGESAARRVAGYLLGLYRETGRSRVTLPVSKKDVASQLGLTPETLSRRLAQLEAAGLIRVDGRDIHLLDIGQLASAGD